MVDWGDWLARLAGAAAVLVVFVLHRRYSRQFRIASGWVDWCRTAGTLSWADRWRLYWATATGRAVSEARLARLAAQRAEAAHAMQRAGGAKSRRYWLLFAGLFLALAAANAARGTASGLASVFAIVGLGYLYLGATVGAARRSAEANRALAERNAAQ